MAEFSQIFLLRWDENLIDSESRIELLWNRFTDLSLMQKAGLDAKGVQAPVSLDSDGTLTGPSKQYAGQYGRFARPAPDRGAR